jgi:hypothetical protein
MTEQTKDVAYVGVLRVQKRCMNCNKMIPAGETAAIRHFSKTWFGWQAGGFLGESKYLRTHAAHVECARQYPIVLGRANAAEIRGLRAEG